MIQPRLSRLAGIADTVLFALVALVGQVLTRVSHRSALGLLTVLVGMMVEGSYLASFYSF